MTKVTVSADEAISAARGLGLAGRWRMALSLLDAAASHDPKVQARLALAAAQAAMDSEWFTDGGGAERRLRSAEERGADLDPYGQWDLSFLQLRYAYFGQIRVDGQFHPGPAGKDPAGMADLRHRADKVREQAPDGLRQGWAEMYLGLIADNVFGERDAAPPHYQAALRAGESSGDDLLVREALRHLGDHDHDAGDHDLALERWQRATALGAGAGHVLGTLSQQILLAVLARDRGDDAGATVLATEIARWATALGAASLAAQAHAFLAGEDPTAPPEDHD